MAEQKPVGEKAKSLKQSPSSSSSRRSTSPRTTPGGSTPPPPASGANQAARLASQARQQEQNNAAFARLFATLEGEQRKLRELEARRMKLTEEMKGLRALLLKENQRLKTTVAPLLNPPAMPSTSGSSKPGVPKRRASPAALVPSPGPAVAPKPASGGVVAEPPAPPTPGVPHPTPSPAPNRTPTPNVPKPTPSPVVADPAEGEDPPATPTAILTSNVPAIPSILKKTSSTGPAAVEPGQAKTVAINIRPRASSTGSMQRRAKGVGARGRMLRKKNHKGKNRSSARKCPCGGPQWSTLHNETLFPFQELSSRSAKMSLLWTRTPRPSPAPYRLSRTGVPTRTPKLLARISTRSWSPCPPCSPSLTPSWSRSRRSSPPTPRK